MSPRQSTLSRYTPYIIAGAAVVTYLSYRIYSNRASSSRRLKRSNARRLPRRHRSAGAGPDPGGVLTNEQLHEVLNQEDTVASGRLPPGIDIPDSVAEALVETGHAAQEARGAGNHEARAGRPSDQESEFSFAAETKENMENQNLLTLLYTIAQDQAQRESYVHRGVTCNNCSCVPIRGVRYRCANCLDYDLCEQCEALDSAHPKTHLFYKVRIPAPFLGNPRHAQTPWYPGKPQMMPISLGTEPLKYLGDVTKSDQSELEALYEQFKTLAASEYNDETFNINGAISRETFDKCFIPNTHLHAPPPNIIYDRMFSFYDTKNDGLIDFEEFVVGLSTINNKSKVSEKLRRVFAGYDLDGDGYVDRQDFLRMFKAFYSLSKDVVRDIVASMGDELYDPGHMDSVLLGRQPISAAFTSHIPVGHRPLSKPSPPPEDEGDEDPDSSAVLPSGTDRIDPEEVARELPLGGKPSDEPRPPTPPKGSPQERERRIEKERRAEFFVLKDEPEDDDLDLPEEERDVGSEVLYQISMQGINELLDILFAAKERAAIEARVEDEDCEESKDGEGVDVNEEKDYEEAKSESSKPERTEASEGREGAREALEGMRRDMTGEDASEESSNRRRSPAPSPESSTQNPSSLQTPQQPLTKEQIREEIKERGGEGRLNYEEFEKLMTGPDASRLRFVSSWTDFASF